ncbi:hypothetical protein C6502_22565 [Candidatus Poribacteria bacterium]|nr:MAG: hypothetical protein C6502_22565 [Candidatus Poribacteria bacterium]
MRYPADQQAATGTNHSFDANVYTRLGVKPFINANLPFTFLSATVVWPEVRRAIDEAAHYMVDVVELQRGVGRRLAEISGTESGMVSSGAAGSMALATAACIAGTDPEKIWQLPDTTGLKDQVIMWGGRSIFDSALRLVGGKPVVVKSLDALHRSINDQTAMLCTGYSADPDPVDPPPLAEMVSICRSAGVPIFVDAAGGIPPIDNIRRYARMGVDLYGFSGGKGLRGPQASGLLFGRRDLIEAALANATPVEGAVCRAMKVGKEEIIGCMAALEKWLTIDLDALYREQTETLKRIAGFVESVPGVKTKIELRNGSNRFMQLVLDWDEEAFGLTVDECGRELREGDPPISVLCNYNPYVTRVREFFPPTPPKGTSVKRQSSPLTVFSLSLQPGEEQIVGIRLRDVLIGALRRTVEHPSES